MAWAFGFGRRRAQGQLSSPNQLSGSGAWHPPRLGRDEQKSLTAAGFRVRHQDTDSLRRLIQPWQMRAFAYYDMLGEIKYSSQFYSRMLSPLRLYPAMLDENGDWVEINRGEGGSDGEKAHAALDRVQDPGGGREGLQGSYGRLMFLVGETILLCTTDDETGVEQWEMLSTDEVRIQGGTILRYKAPSQQAEELREAADDDWAPVEKGTAVPYRLWKRHPRYSMWADSSMQGVLDLCVAEGSPINTLRGPVPIEEVEVGDQVAAWTADGLGWRPVVRHLERGEQSVVRITAGRRRITATAEHPVLVLRQDNPGKGYRCNYECEWVPAGEIETGDHLVALDHMPEYGTLQRLPDGVPVDEDIAWLLGHIVGDGHVHAEGLNIALYNEERRLRVCAIMEHWWGLRDHPQGGNARFFSRALRMTLEEVGLRVKSHRKRVPEVILASPSWIKRAFLAGYEEADGHLTKQGWQSLALTSDRLARELRALYIELGENVSNLHVEERAPVMAMPGGYVTVNAKPLHRFQVYYGSIRKGSANVLRTLESREAIGGEHFTIATVKSVEAAGICRTYDLEVEGAHTYVADGVVSHNCEELVLLTQAVRARARSRLAGSGILFLDSRISEPPAETAPDEDPAEDPYLNRLTQAMMAPIADEGTASAIVPLISRVEVPDNMKMADLVHHLQIVDPMQVYPETGLRIECIHRIAIGLDMPPEELEGKSDANHWCQSEDTEIFARGRGWIRHDELKVGDDVYTLNHETGEAEWQAVDSIYRAPVENETMYSLESRSHSSLSTPAHRWPIVKTGYKVSGSRRRWTTSADGFAQGDRVPLAARVAGAGSESSYSDDFVRLLVAFTADGTVQKHDNIRIAKFAETEIAEMRRILTSVFGEGGFREHRHETRTVDGVAFVLRKAEARQILACCGKGKAIKLEFVEAITHEQRLLMLESCIEIGDGVRVDAAVTLYQVEEGRLEAFAYAAHTCGFKVTYGKRDSQTGFGTTPLSWVRWTAANDSFAPALCEESLTAYSGIVWCPSTANRTWFARRNGSAYFTGNTVWNIDEQTWKAHGMPVANQLVGDLTAAYFRPQLRSDGVTEAQNFAIRYDATNVINHPDKSKDAKDAFDRVALSHEALRVALGFNEDDAPSEEERAERVGILTRDSSLAWDGIPSPRGGFVETTPGVVDQAEVPGAPSATPAEPGGGAAEHGPPPEPADRVDDVTASGNGKSGLGDLRLHRILGASDLALLRAREAAGNRLKSLAKKKPEMADLIADVHAREVPAVLGPDRVRELRTTEGALVESAADLIRDALRLWQIDGDAADLIAAQLQTHAARTLYERVPPPLPHTFASYIDGLLKKG